MRKFALISLVALTLVLTLSESAGAQIAVVVHNDNPIEDLSSADLKRIYLGKKTLFPHTERIMLCEHTPQKERFYQLVTNKSLRSLRQHWIKLIFNGDSATPPKEFARTDEVFAFVSSHRGAIGFVNAGLVTDEVKVVTIDGSAPGQPDYALK